ncbi:hypothetical protein OV208_09495 [Corallococcus sp. bb12-1]|uniref:hypothetical protein n=1 Tax=Corallococcus sp. bb12-1 TaxID=2996784 RepID=UPI00226DF196|nr:hypothetical protein [Corallococcus sp. bb12-1]MCY1041547.1 hypothetical protein [Corallococcus sp. bb12-1]
MDEPRHGRQDRHPLEPVAQGCWLVIPYKDTDEGERTVPAGETFWESNYIWMRDMSGQRVAQATAGQPVRVFVRIRNRGTLTSFPTRVTFAFVDASLGIAWSAPRVLAQVGTNVPPNQLGPGVMDVECPVPWVPGPFSTHACLLVMCDGVLMDRPTVPWSAGFDRHVAQHNVTIVPAAPGSTLTFPLQFATVLASTSTVRFAAQAAWVEASDAEQVLRYAPGRRGVRGTLLEPGIVKESFRPGRIETVGALDEGPLDYQAEAHGEAVGFVALGEPLESRPRELQRVDFDLTVPFGEEAPFLLIRLAQVEDGLVTGGYTGVFQLRP